MADEEHNRRQALGGAPPIAAMGQHMRTVIRWLAAVIGFVLILIAIPIGVLTPLLPIGLPIAVAGVILLGRNSHWGRDWMERVLVRHPQVERAAPNWVMQLVFGRDKRPRPPRKKR